MALTDDESAALWRVALACDVAIRPDQVAELVRLGSKAVSRLAASAECPWCTAPVRDGDPVKPLGEFLTRVLDDDQFNHAGPMLNDLRRLIAASTGEAREVVRGYLLNHPNAVEDNGRVTIDVPVQFAHRAEITTRFLADWLAPAVPQRAPTEGREP